MSIDLSKLSIQEYKAGDENLIIELSQVRFRHPLDLATWKWKYKLNPWGFRAVLAFYEGQVIGNYSSYFVPVNLNGIKKIVNVIADSMTHNKLRSNFTFIRLCNTHSDYLIQNKIISFSYGFAGRLALKIGEKKLGYYSLGNVKMWTLQKIHKINQKLLKSEALLPEYINSIWSKCQNNFEISVVKNYEYFYWRYFLKPNENYHFYSNMGETAFCFLVVKIKNNKVFILDYIFIPGYEDEVVGLLREICEKYNFDLCLFEPKSIRLKELLLNYFKLEVNEQEYSITYGNTADELIFNRLSNGDFNFTLGDYDCY